MNQASQNQETKKQWLTPELIVLVRSNPEEAVLAACKSTPSAGPCIIDHNQQLTTRSGRHILRG